MWLDKERSYDRITVIHTIHAIRLILTNMANTALGKQFDLYDLDGNGLFLDSPCLPVLMLLLLLQAKLTWQDPSTRPSWEKFWMH